MQRPVLEGKETNVVLKGQEKLTSALGPGIMLGSTDQELPRLKPVLLLNHALSGGLNEVGFESSLQES